MYLIWNNRIWGAYRASDGWRPYAGCARATRPVLRHHLPPRPRARLLLVGGRDGPHVDWTGTPAAVDYGPCRDADLNWAAPYHRPAHDPLPVVRPR